MTKRAHKIAMAVMVAALGALGRILLAPYPNFEVVTLATMVAAMALGMPYAFVAPLTLMVLSDLILGIYEIAIFTWSGFAIMGLSFTRLRKLNGLSGRNVGTITAHAALMVLFYDGWTAFGWWLIYYPHTMATLTLVYILQVPFTIKHLLSVMITVPPGAALLLALPGLCRTARRYWAEKCGGVVRGVREKYILYVAHK